MSLSASKGGLFALAFSFAVSGCQCPQPPNPGTDAGPEPSIAFASLPPDGVNCSDDADPNTPGEQLDVTVVLVDGADCTSVTVTNSRTDPASSADGTFTDGTAKVTVTLVGSDAGAENPITATCTTSDGTVLKVTDTVVDSCGGTPITPCDTPLLTIDAPAENDQLTASPTTVSVHTSVSPTDCVASDAQNALLNDGLVTCVADNGTAGATSTIQLATGAGSTSDLALPGDGATTITCTLADDAANPAFPGQTATASVPVTVSLGSLEITSPAEGQDFNSDADGPLNGISVPLTGSVAAGTQTVSFVAVCDDDNDPATGENRVTGSSDTGEVTLTPGSDGVDFSADLPNLALSPCTVTVTADDVQLTRNFTVTVDTPVFQVTLTPPLHDGAYNATDDADTTSANTIDASAQITVTSGDVTGLTGTVQLVDPSGTATTLASGADLSSAITQALSLPFSDEAHWTLVVFATDGTDEGVHFTVPILVDTVAPTVSIDFPAENDHLTAVFDLSTDPGFQCPFAATVSGLAAGDTFDVVDATLGTVGTCRVSGTSCSGTLTLPDGTFAVTVTVVDHGGNPAASAVRHFTADGTPPQVTGIAVATDADGNGVVNVAENGAAAGGNITSNVTVTFAATAGIEDGRNVTVTSSINGTNVGSKSAPAAGNAVTVTNLPLGQGLNHLTVTASDAAGNPVAVAGSTLDVLVDTVLPAVAISEPTGAVLNSADDVGADPGLQVDILVTTDQPAGAPVDLLDGTTVVATANTDDQGRAFFLAQSLADGTHQLTAAVTDAAGNPATSATYAPVVDTTPPSLAITDPAEGATLTNGDDQQPPIADGIQYDVHVATDLGAGATVTVHSDTEQGGVLGSGTTDAAGNAVIRVTFLTDGSQQLTATASDQNGNPGTSAVVTVTVDTGLYVVAFDSPALRGNLLAVTAADDTNASTAGVQVVVVASIANPDIAAAPTAVLRLNGSAAPVAPATLGPGDTFTFQPITLTDGQTGTLEVVVTDTNLKTGTTGAKSFEVDVGSPVVTFVTPAGPSATFNAASESGANASSPGLQTTITVSVAECEGGSITVVRDGSTPIGNASDASLTAAAKNEAIAINDTLESNGQSWVVTCTDRVGNTGSATLTANVDVTAPGTPALTTQVVSIRRGQVAVRYTEPGDDGAAGGNVAACTTIASRQAITSANFDTLAALASTPGNGGTIDSSPPIGAGSQRTVNATALAFDNSWNFATRCRDDAGNTSLSTVNLPAAQFSTSQTNAGHTESDVADGATVDDNFAGAAFGTGDLNNDGSDDVVLTAWNEGDLCVGGFCDGRIFIFAGGAGGLASTPAKTLTVPVVGGNFGIGAALLDFDGDGISDLLATGYDENFSENRLYVFYGTGDAQFVADPVLMSTPFVGGSQNWDVVIPVGDVDGDGTDDAVFLSTAASGGSGAGEALLVRGQATRLTAGDLVADTQSTRIQVGTSGATVFNAAAAGLGALNNDAFDDFVLSTDNGANANSLFVILGRAAADWPPTLDVATASSQRIACAGANCGAGSLSAGNVDATGGADLVAAKTGSFVVFASTAGALAASPTFTISAAGLSIPAAGQGPIGVVGDVNGDGADDILAPRVNAGVSTVALFLGQAGSANRTTPDASYDFSFSAFDSCATPRCGNVDGDSANIDEICLGTNFDVGAAAVRQ